MMRLGLGIRLQPFLETAIGTDLIWREPGAFFSQFLPQFFVHTQNFRSAHRISEELA